MNCAAAIDVMGDVLEGGLEPALRAGFEEHMTECASCRNYLQHLEITRKALQLLPRDGDTNPRRKELIEKFKKEFHRGRGSS